MNFGKTILELRKQKNLTQEELAANLGVTAAAVSKWENNYSLPDILMLCALADFFDITTDELLGRNKERKYAMIAAPTRELADKTQALAEKYGLETLRRFDDFAEALEAANDDARVSCLLVSSEEARFSMEEMHARDNLKVIVSLGSSHEDILKGFERMLRD